MIRCLPLSSSVQALQSLLLCSIKADSIIRTESIVFVHVRDSVSEKLFFCLVPIHNGEMYVIRRK